MKIRRLAVLLFVLCSLQISRAAEQSVYHLDLNRPPPKAGDETERTIQLISTTSNTNIAKGWETATNTARYFELKGREKFLSWDAANDSSKVEMTVEKLMATDGRQTVQLAKPGVVLIGSSLLGENFFESKDGTISPDCYRQLEMLYNIRPRTFNEFTRAKIPPSLSVGDTWTVVTPMDSEALRVLGLAFTNGVTATGRLVGTTNLFGLDCFQLQLQVTSTETPEFLRRTVEARLPVKLKVNIELTVDLIVPFDESRQILVKNYFVDYLDSGEMVIDGKNVMSSHGRTTMKIMSESRPITPQ
jgi:hypothetical protein